MNIQKIDELSAKIADIEKTLFQIDAEFPNVAPDLDSAIASKVAVLMIFKQIHVIKGDLKNYREGKSIPKPNLNDLKSLFGKLPPMFDKDGPLDGPPFFGQ